MNDFTASNGVAVREVTPVTDRGPWLLVDGEQVSPNNAQALREFFQAEADERLGRWRWPENPDVTVRVAPKHAQRPASDGVTVMIQQDSDGYVGYYDRDELPEITDKTGCIVRAGHAYFDAHPEPKPWCDAQPGDVFLVTWPGSEREEAVVVPGAWPKAWECVTSARRIWPEPQS